MSRSSRESRFEHSDEAVLLIDDLPPSDPHDVPAGQLEIEVAAAVALEGEGVTVGRATVGLDHEPLRRPVEVDLVSGDEAVDDRPR
jgi:hypothetical protein